MTATFQEPSPPGRASWLGKLAAEDGGVDDGMAASVVNLRSRARMVPGNEWHPVRIWPRFRILKNQGVNPDIQARYGLNSQLT